MTQEQTGQPLVIQVDIDVALTELPPGATTDRQKIGKLTWYYNGLCGKQLELRVPYGYQGIEFRLSPDAARQFFFKDPIITRNKRAGTEEYPDLTGEFKRQDDHVLITDLMVNTAHAKVGKIELAVDLHPHALLDGVLYDPDTFRSDPQVTNTGQET